MNRAPFSWGDTAQVAAVPICINTENIGTRPHSHLAFPIALPHTSSTRRSDTCHKQKSSIIVAAVLAIPASHTHSHRQNHSPQLPSPAPVPELPKYLACEHVSSK